MIILLQIFFLAIKLIAYAATLIASILCFRAAYIFYKSKLYLWSLVFLTLALGIIIIDVSVITEVIP